MDSVREVELAVYLTPPQSEVLERRLLTSGFNCVLQMPTGSGKTWLAEQAMSETLSAGARAVYLAPLRALATERVAEWRDRFPGTSVGIFTGDFGLPGSPLPVPFREARLLVMTPERLDACTRSWRSHWSWIPDVDLVIVDELHLLGDRSRGARLEGTLSRFRRLNPFARIAGLSATLGNRTELADWLDGVDYSSTWRPVPLTWRIVRYARADDKPDVLVREVAAMTGQGGQTLVFVQSRRRAEALSSLLEGSGISASHHHAGLTHTARRETETRFRTRQVDVLVATSTLEMGLNLPARNVVLYDLQEFDGTDFRPLSVSSVWQRVGRAGRPGLDTVGEAVLMAPTWDREASRYELGRFEEIRSGVSSSSALAEQILAEVSSGLARTPSQLRRALATYLAARQGVLPDVSQTTNEMCTAGMLREAHPDDDHSRALQLRPTRLGRIACRHLLAPATVITFRRVLEALPEATFLDLLVASAATLDCDPVLPADFEELDDLAEGLRTERSLILRMPLPQVTQLLPVAGKRLLAAIKMALVARAWTRTADAEVVAARYGCYPFEVDRLRESLVRLLLAAAAVAKPEGTPEEPVCGLDEPEVTIAERLAALHAMVAAGLDEEAVTLTLVPGIGPSLARRLTQAGVGNIEDLALSSPEDVGHVRGVSQARARQWITKAVELVRQYSAYRYRELGPTCEARAAEWPQDIAPYRLRRALELQVSLQEAGLYVVVGGLEPHIVRKDRGSVACDCPDFAKGNLCKHVLAVRLSGGDRALGALVRRLKAEEPGDGIDLFRLWFGKQDLNARRKPR